MLNNKVVLITGGTGSFGKKCTEVILEKYTPKKLIIFSRDELKQFEMSQVFSKAKYPCIRYFIGDVRDGKCQARCRLFLETLGLSPQNFLMASNG